MSTIHTLQPCPFGYKALDIITHPVPEHLQEEITKLWMRRAELNKFQSLAGGEDWYQQSKSMYEAFEKVEDELRGIAEAPRRSCVEYYAGWRFRCPDQNTLRAQYLAACAKSEPSEVPEPSNPGR